MFLGGDFVGDEVTGYLQIVAARSQRAGKNKGEEREREGNAFLRFTPYLPHPSLFFLLASLCTVPQSEYLEQAGTFAM